MKISDYCASFPVELADSPDDAPWDVLSKLGEKLAKVIGALGTDYAVNDGVAIHKSANVHPTAEIQAPAVIGPDCFVGPNAMLRGGVFMGAAATIGFCCEVKSSIVCAKGVIAHLSYVGDSIVGTGVDLEAGAQVVNYYNEREDKVIAVFVDGERIETGVIKFGALIGDKTKIGANAVLAPGTVLPRGSIVKRLELVDQASQK